jgi:DNA-binding response OmpR family regulator
MKILIIEDEKSIAEMYQKQFALAGHQVRVANNGAEGLKAIEAEKPQVTLLDLIMPVVNGYDVLKQLGKADMLSKMKVYILSNLGQEDEIEKGMAMGAKAYLVKSRYTPKELLKKVEALAMA